MSCYFQDSEKDTYQKKSIMLKLGNHEDISNREMNIFKYINSKEENNNIGFRIKIEKVKYKT